MPYRSSRELPDSVKDNLPSLAQDIYREAFDSTWDEYQDPDSGEGTSRARSSRTRSPGPR